MFIVSLKLDVICGGENGMFSPPLFGLEGFFHTIALSGDFDGFAVVQDTVQDCGGNGIVFAEDLGPILVRFIGGDYSGAAFIAITDHLKEQVCSIFINGQIAQFIQNQ